MRNKSRKNEIVFKFLLFLETKEKKTSKRNRFILFFRNKKRQARGIYYYNI